MRLLDEADDLKLLRCGEPQCLVSPIPDHAFFEQPQFRRLLGDRFIFDLNKAILDFVPIPGLALIGQS